MKVKTSFVPTILSLSLAFCRNNGGSFFSDDTYSDTIKQKIGGLLVREIQHSNDHHSYSYEVRYSYNDQFNKTYNIGIGSYYAQKPPENEQIVIVGSWKVFKTSMDRNMDAIFVYDVNKSKWVEYEISPTTVEQEALWKNQKIDSEINNWKTASKINKIDEFGVITVHYRYAKRNRTLLPRVGECLISYRLNSETGRPEMTRVSPL